MFSCLGLLRERHLTATQKFIERMKALGVVVILCCLSLFSTVVSATMKCNGMEELCNLRLNQVTLPGTHNSGSGANGRLYHWEGGLAPSRLWRNQQWGFTKQLDYGIRYFDIDTCYVDKVKIKKSRECICQFTSKLTSFYFNCRARFDTILSYTSSRARQSHHINQPFFNLGLR